MRIFVKNQAAVRAEIIWAFLTVYRNLSFNFSDYISEYLSHIYSDSKFASLSTINRHKTKKIIEVFVGILGMNQMKYIKKKASFMLDFSRDISNLNEFIIAVKYFDEEKFKIITTVLEVLEQNQTKSEILFKSFTSFLSDKKIEVKNMISITTDNAHDMVGKENGLVLN